MALCHDALAEGVLAGHDGKLPASWVAMFKAHPAAWEQLTEAVVAAPYAREEDRPFGFDAIVQLTLAYSDSGNGVHKSDAPEILTSVVRADALPLWFYHLLEAWLRVTRVCPGGGGCQSGWHDISPSGGIELAFNSPKDVSRLYETICEIADTNGEPYDTICHNLTVQLFDDFLLDPTYELWDDIRYNNRLLEKEGKRCIVASEMSTSELLRYFEAIGRHCALKHIRRWIFNSGDLQEEDMLRILVENSLECPVLRQYVPCPAFSLCFYFGENNVYWTGEAPDC
jgi:hypothetical protein